MCSTLFLPAKFNINHFTRSKAYNVLFRQTLPGEVQPDDLVFLALHQVGARSVRRVPVCHRQEDALRVAGGRQVLARKHPVARAVPAARGLHVSRPVPHVEVETGVKQWTRHRTHKLHEQIFTCADDRVWELSHAAKRTCDIDGKGKPPVILHVSFTSAYNVNTQSITSFTSGTVLGLTQSNTHLVPRLNS